MDRTSDEEQRPDGSRDAGNRRAAAGRALRLVGRVVLAVDLAACRGVLRLLRGQLVVLDLDAEIFDKDLPGWPTVVLSTIAGVCGVAAAPAFAARLGSEPLDVTLFGRAFPVLLGAVTLVLGFSCVQVRRTFLASCRQTVEALVFNTATGVNTYASIEPVRLVQQHRVLIARRRYGLARTYSDAVQAAVASGALRALPSYLRYVDRQSLPAQRPLRRSSLVLGTVVAAAATLLVVATASTTSSNYEWLLVLARTLS